jgi:hypothetical protein
MVLILFNFVALIGTGLDSLFEVICYKCYLSKQIKQPHAHIVGDLEQV